MCWRTRTHVLIGVVSLHVGIERAAAFSASELTVRTADGVTLGATLTLPDTSSARPSTGLPGVLLVSGSGPNDRDEHVVGSDGGAYSPLRIIAGTLSDAGFAVLRYDKRTCSPANGHPGCTSNLAGLDMSMLTIQDFRNDALAALRVLKMQPGVRRTGLAVIGHSQGATPVAPMVCSSDEDVSHCVLLMGHGVPIDEVMVRQYRDIGQTTQADAYSRKFAALRQEIAASPAWRWPLAADPTLNRAQLAASIADVNPMPDGSTAFFWATWIRATETTSLQDMLSTFMRRGGQLLSVNSVQDFNCNEVEFQPLRGLVSTLGGTAVVMDHLLHILAPTPVTRALLNADPSPVCSTLLSGLTIFLSTGDEAADGGKLQRPGGDGQVGWPVGPTVPCGHGADGSSPMQCEQCADAALACNAGQQASFALLLSSMESQISVECQALFRLLLGAEPAVSVDSPELCELGCWEAVDVIGGCEDSVCDCTLGAGDAVHTLSAAAALCAPRPPSAAPGTSMHSGYCEAVGTGGMVVAACQHGRCTDTVNDIASPALAAAVAGTNLDAALSAYPCRPCNYAVSDLDDLDPVAEETLGAALKERLAYSAVAVVFDCGSNSPVEYEMLFTLPELSLAGFHVGAAGAIGLPLHSLATFDAACGGEAGTTMGELPAECAPSGSTPAIFPGSDGGGAVPNRVCGPVTLAIAMQFLNACNGGDFALARCAFSPAVAGALDTATLGSLYEDHACEQPDGFRMERSNGMDVVIIRCDDLQAGLIQWSIAVGPGQIAGLHFNAYGGDFERIPAQCFPGGSLPRACSGSGH